MLIRVYYLTHAVNYINYSDHVSEIGYIIESIILPWRTFQAQHSKIARQPINSNWSLELIHCMLMLQEDEKCEKGL